MNQSSFCIPMDPINRKLNRRFAASLVAFALLYVLVLTFPASTQAVAVWAGGWAPVVRAQLIKDGEVAAAAARYFSLLVLAVPLASIYTMWDVNPLEQLRKNSRLLGGASAARGREAVLVAYLLGLPLSVLLLLVIFFAPIEGGPHPPDRRASGSKVLDVLRGRSSYRGYVHSWILRAVDFDRWRPFGRSGKPLA